ncbi:DUF6531 domain-containing protein [Microlunatus soli]|uniref:RHS repeat-associated core domain-containing protein n=1 Tax=Microlunatus soli TaxID=630515 RepID=A0A1H1MKT5_9ACTN|nr:DUF6531 domain-containing protein [Microlunatus soli]SDR87454.1 RHS repeat-associated core domain-containing protein [Microlunatus soli]
MSSDPDTWGGLPDVKIDNTAADSLISGCKDAASKIRTQCTNRRTHTTSAMNDFKGLFSQIFERNQGIANEDGGQIATALDDIARQVQYIKDLVPDENRRRREAREWKKRHDEDKAHITLSDLGGDEDPPEGPKPPPAPKQYSANAKDRENPMPGEGGGGGGGGSTSSARPSALRDFAKSGSGEIEAMNGRSSKLSGLESDFNSGFDWGVDGTTGVNGSAVYTAFGTYHKLNQQDQTWVGAVASAFEKAGGSGSMVTVSNSALTASVQRAGVSVNRTDIPPTSPARLGVAPTTGYSDDPVNTSTGNFVEPEADLEFAGGCGSLSLNRMYNSFNHSVGAFGPGWTSWTESKINFTDQAGYLTQPDGRVVEFPRSGTGWGRAIGLSLWLQRDDAADELRVTDNDGGTWRFTTAGTLLSQDRGEGTMINFRRTDGRLVALEHERGRSITLEWDGELVVAATASDGRRVSYDYDSAGRLTAATGEGGTRSYRWDDAGLITEVVDADGVVEVHNSYDGQGRVTSQRSPHGRTSRYSYLPGNVTEVADLDGTRANTWLHDGRGRLIGIIDSFDQRQSTSYDTYGNPVQVVGRDGRATVREYDERGHVLREVSPSGAEIQYGWDDSDRLLTVVTGEGAVTTYGYQGSQRNPSELTDPEGGVTRLFWRDGLLVRMVDPTGVALQFDYNEHGDLIATTNAAGNSARLEYDAAGRVVAAVTPSGNRTTFVHGAHGITERHDPDGAVSTYEYTAGGRLAATVDPTGARTELEYGEDGEESRTIDPLGRTVQRRLDDLGNLAAVELPDGSSWRFSHDSLSRLSTTTTPAGHSWTWKYGRDGSPTGVVDPLGHEISVSSDAAGGEIISRDETGTVTHRFDPLGRPIAVGQLDDSAAITAYDRCGRPVELLDPEGALTRIERDAAGRPIAFTSPVGDVTRFEYDECGRRSATIDPLGGRTTIGYDADSRPVRVTLPTGEVGWTSYDRCGRITATFSPGIGTTSYGYDLAGRVIVARDPDNGRRRFRYDSAGQLTSVVNGNGGVTRYDYDAAGRNTTITDPLGNVTRREFDAENRCIAETDALGRTTTAGYDAVGHQVWQTEPGGRRTEWTYDAAGRVASIAVDGREISSIQRDLRNRRVTITDRSRPDRVSTQQLEWNRRDQLIRQERDGNAVQWSYDAAGRRTSMTTPDGNRTTYSYDAANRLAVVDHPLLGRAGFTRDRSGRLIGATAGAESQTWGYADGFVSAHTVSRTDGSVRTTIDRDDDGRITRIDRDDVDGSGRSTTFDYDEACQLIAARLVDGLGESVSRWRYDAAGRLIAETRDGQSRTYDYDAAAQLISSTDAGGTTSYHYDDAGRRVRTDFADGRQRDYSWSPTGYLSGVTDRVGDRVRTTRMQVDSTGQLASIAGESGELSTYWDTATPYAPGLVQVGDASVLGTPAAVGIGDQWTATGWRPSRATGHDPWTIDNGGATDLPGGLSIGAAGELNIAGLEWLHARAYDPSTRGFLSVDPLEPELGAGWAGNPYSYAGNDPLQALDPTGLKPVSQADLENARKPWYEKAWDATTGWVKNNWEYLAGGAMVLAGGVMVATGFGGPAGMMLISAGADTIIQKATTGEVNWGEVAVSGALGGVGGLGVAAKVGATGLKAAAITGAVSGGVGGAGMGAYRYSTGPGPHTVGGFLTATGTGAVSGAALGGAGGAAGHGLAAVGGKVLQKVRPKPSPGTSIPSDSVRFSQNKAGAGVAEIRDSMRANGWKGDPIDVVKMQDGGLTSLDNRRLLAAKMAGIDVKANVHGFDDLIPGEHAGRFPSRKGVIPETWGEAASNRIGNQSAGYRNAWPNGSPWTGYEGN